MIQSLLVAHPSAITLEHCTRLAEIFDGDGNGTIEADEFLYFCKVVALIAYLEGKEGELHVVTRCCTLLHVGARWCTLVHVVARCCTWLHGVFVGSASDAVDLM